ncbi:TraX family protein [Enterococcus raffinosus]|uniref:TraX family protein n=1 Tax=Enterococcus raffinosus TaxID=71452 RepID=UPI003D6BC768
MLSNHIGSGFSIYEQSSLVFFFTEFIGKLTFPIMAYLLVEGFLYTRNRKHYAIRMMIFWLISIYPFHLLFNGKNPFTLIELVNNFFTLLIGLLLMIVYEKVASSFLRYLVVYSLRWRLCFLIGLWLVFY